MRDFLRSARARPDCATSASIVRSTAATTCGDLLLLVESGRHGITSLRARRAIDRDASLFERLGTTRADAACAMSELDTMRRNAGQHLACAARASHRMSEDVDSWCRRSTIRPSHDGAASELASTISTSSVHDRDRDSSTSGLDPPRALQTLSTSRDPARPSLNVRDAKIGMPGDCAADSGRADSVLGSSASSVAESATAPSRFGSCLLVRSAYAVSPSRTLAKKLVQQATRRSSRARSTAARVRSSAVSTASRMRAMAACSSGGGTANRHAR